MQATEECPVCQLGEEEGGGEWWLSLPCGHPLCFGCLDGVVEWSYTSRAPLACPLCRAPLRPGQTLFGRGAPHRQVDLRHDLTLLRYVSSGARPREASRRRWARAEPLVPRHRGLDYDGYIRDDFCRPGVAMSHSWRLEVDARLGPPSPARSDPGGGTPEQRRRRLSL